MTLTNGSTASRTGNVRPRIYMAEQLQRLCGDLPRAMRVLLLESAVLAAFDELGCPLNDEAEDVFQLRVDQLYWGSIAAARPVRGTFFANQLKARRAHRAR